MLGVFLEEKRKKSLSKRSTKSSTSSMSGTEIRESLDPKRFGLEGTLKLILLLCRE